MSTIISEISSLNLKADHSLPRNHPRSSTESKKTSLPVFGCLGSKTSSPLRQCEEEEVIRLEAEDDVRPSRTSLCLPSLPGFNFPPWNQALSRPSPKRVALTPSLTQARDKSSLVVVARTLVSFVEKFSRTVPTWRCTDDRIQERSLTSANFVLIRVHSQASWRDIWKHMVEPGTIRSNVGIVTCRLVLPVRLRNTWESVLCTRRVQVPCL